MPYIQSGYRRPGDARVDQPTSENTSSVDHVDEKKEQTHYLHDTFYKCWKSVWCYWHNETVNIHTHLWGAVIAILLLFLQLADLHEWLPGGPWPIFSLHTLPSPDILERYPGLGLRIAQADAQTQRLGYVRAPPDDLAFLSVFLLSAMACLGCSATYHTVACHSERTALSYNRLDYAGIVLLIVGSNVPALHFGFHCHPHLRTLYTTLVTIWGTIALYIVTQPKFTVPKYKTLRAMIFIALGLSAVLPVVHGFLIARDWFFVTHVLGARFLMLSGAVYIGGALIYVAHIPERWSPYTFDYIGASHQIFHVCVLLGAWLHWLTVRQAYTVWHSLETSAGEYSREAVCAVVHAATNRA